MRVDFALDYDVLTVEQAQKLYLMARLASGPPTGTNVRRALNLSLVIDRSGSMAGDKIDYIKQAAQFLVQHLSSNDIFSLVLYNDKIETLVPPEIISNKDAINQLIEQIRVRGTTNLSGGWLEGCQHVQTHLSPDRLNRALLMTDGLANRGVTEPDRLVLLARQKREAGISTTTMGLGRDFNEDLLMEMASAGGGAFYFIETPEAAPEIFKEELSGLLNIVGQNLVISVEAGEYVEAVRQLNAYPLQTDGKQTQYRLGDIFADEVKALVLELSIPALQQIGETEIARLRFEYEEIVPEGTQRREHTMDVRVNVRARQEDAPLLPDPEVMQSVLLLQAAQARQEAVRAADAGDFSTASQQLRTAAEAIASAPVKTGTLDEEQASLREQAAIFERDKTGGYDAYMRKTMRTQSFYSQQNRHDETMVLRKRELSRQEETNTEPDEDEIFAVLGMQEQVDGSPQAPTHLRWRDRIFRLEGDLIRVGRADHNEIVIQQKGVSRFHCQLRRVEDGYLLEDLGSTNGTLVAGKRIQEPRMIRAGDVVYLCEEKLIFYRA